MEIVSAQQEDREPALEVWHAANVARGLRPSAERIERVRVKLAAADAQVLVGRVDTHVRAMVLAEPWRDDDGAGPVVAGRGHVSMVFVDPSHWSHGLATAMLTQLHQILAQRGWTRVTLWTRESNHRARRLYARLSYQPTGRTDALPTGERVLELERSEERVHLPCRQA